MLFLFLLSLLTVSGFISGRDKNLVLSWLALAPGATTATPVFASTLPGWFHTFPGGGLGMLIWVHWCRRRGTLGLGPLILAGIHLLARQVLHQTPRSRRLFKWQCCGAMSGCTHSHSSRVEEFFSSKSLWLWLHPLHCLYDYSSGG